MYVARRETMQPWTRFSNPRPADVDEHAATELRLYLDNDQRFSPQSPQGQGRSIVLNLLRKMKKGNYDHALAPKLWGYLVESAAKAYAKEFASPGEWSQIFSPATRRAVAQELADDFQRDAKAGEYAHLNLKRGA